MPLLQCGHDAGAPSRRVCRHLLDQPERAYYWRFTGERTAFDLICNECRQAGDHGLSSLGSVCDACFDGIRSNGDWVGFVGDPGVNDRPSGLWFAHSEVAVGALVSERLLDIQPITSLDRNLWVAVTAAGAILRIDLDASTVTTLSQLTRTTVNLAEEISLVLSACGRMAAVVNQRGRYGVVIDLAQNQMTMGLDRGDYHVEHCNFPVAFFEDRGRVRLIVIV